jgi:hypothetical protein
LFIDTNLAIQATIISPPKTHTTHQNCSAFSEYSNLMLDELFGRSFGSVLSGKTLFFCFCLFINYVCFFLVT